MSDATIMQGELLELLRGRKPKTQLWKREMYFGTGPEPASGNKWVNNNACEALWCLMTGDRARAAMIVTHMGNWIKDNGFMSKEITTPEEVYRALPLNGHATLAGIAQDMGSSHYLTILHEARGSIIHLAKGVGKTPGRKVMDHQLDKVGKNVILIGDGKKFASANRYVVQVGMRGWVRNRAKGEPKIFLFADNTGLSQMLALAAGLNPGRKQGQSEYDFYHALKSRFPSVPVYGCDTKVQSLLQQICADPANAMVMVELMKLIKEQRCGIRQKHTRYADCAIAALMYGSHESSTEAVIFNMWYANGKTVKGSAGTGAREGQGSNNIEAARGWEDNQFWYWQDFDGGDAMQKWPKHTAEIAYTIDDDPTKPFIEVRDSIGRLLNPGGG